MPQLAGAAFGASRALEEIVAERLKAQMLEAEIADRQQRMQMEQERFGEARKHNEWERGRAEKLDTERSAAAAKAADEEGVQKRGRQNMAGVLGMGLDPQTAKREIAYSSLQSGANVPGGVLQALEPPPKPERDPIADYRSRKEIDEEFEDPQKPERPQVFQVNGKLVDANGRVVYEGAPGAGGGPSPYSQERSVRTLQSVDELMGKINNKTAGWGNLAAGIPASDAMNFESELDTLKANIAFNELTAMREASKTGGALGQVSNIELRLLESALGALNPRQSPENLRAQLAKIKESVQRWQAAQTAPSPVSSHGVTQTAPGPRRMRFDRTGKPIP